MVDLPEFKDIPWIIGGDFNEICFDSEKFGGNRRPYSQTAAFRDVLDECNLQNIHCDGQFFTWVNRRNSDSLIFERLDRYVSTFSWRILYPTATCVALDFYHSDHRPLYLSLGLISAGSLLANKKRRFRFEAMWTRDEECEDIIYKGWKGDNSSLHFLARLNGCSNSLQKWAACRFHSFHRQLKEKRDKLAELRTYEHWQHDFDEIGELETEVERLSTQEELFWRQRSRAVWLDRGIRIQNIFTE